ncbi:MAG: iron-sulfur cluster assembly accessory protein [Candidatus Caenarcaniphilales bacterium]|nr:iron-sulfur cluster assembly accessory protein [Candidatus Caenarcaniphilales bacterium]
MVKLTDSAIKQAYMLLNKEHAGDEKYALRFAVKGGGCSGLSYDLQFDEVSEKDYRQFAEVPEQSEAILPVIVDPKSAIYLKGMEVHFDDGLMGKGFVFKNPNADNTCGCGESFSVF